MDETLSDHASNWTDLCYEKGRVIHDTARFTIKKHIDEKLWFEMLQDIDVLIRSIHPLSSSCIEMIGDYYSSMLIYYETWQDWLMLIFNGLYHMGKIYTSVENSVHLVDNQEVL